MHESGFLREFKGVDWNLEREKKKKKEEKTWLLGEIAPLLSTFNWMEASYSIIHKPMRGVPISASHVDLISNNLLIQCVECFAFHSKTSHSSVNKVNLNSISKTYLYSLPKFYIHYNMPTTCMTPAEKERVQVKKNKKIEGIPFTLIKNKLQGDCVNAPYCMHFCLHPIPPY